MCVSFYYFPGSQRGCYSCQIWNFRVRYALKNLWIFEPFVCVCVWMGCIKQNIDCSFIDGYGEKIIAPSVKFNLRLLFTSALRASVNSRPRLNFTSGTIIFNHSPHEQSIFVYYNYFYFYNLPILQDGRKEYHDGHIQWATRYWHCSWLCSSCRLPDSRGDSRPHSTG